MRVGAGGGEAGEDEGDGAKEGGNHTGGMTTHCSETVSARGRKGDGWRGR